MLEQNNQQSHVTRNYQLSNVYINFIEQMLCCILKWRSFIFTVIAKDRGRSGLCRISGCMNDT